MQTTLLSIAIALILALVAALVAPYVVDWNHYRSAFEAEASRLTGLTVRVNGSIDARILPTPRLKLRNVEAGEPGRAAQMRAGSLELEVGLGPLLRGQVQASEVRLVNPEITLGLDRSGAIDWPALSPTFHPEALSVSRFDVEDGRLVLSDAASGAQLVLQKLRFNGDVRSFVGPFKGDGSFLANGEAYSYRIFGSRAEGDAGFRLRLGIDPSNRPLTGEVEGAITLENGTPQFDGTLNLARLVGATLSSGQRVMSDPWHAAGKIRIDRAAATLKELSFQYGPDERPINFAGKATLKFGDHARLDGTVAALQVDVDRALADPDMTHRPPLLSVKDFLEAFVAAVQPPVPAAIGIGIDAVTIGGTTIQSLRGTLRFDADGWNLDDFDFRAPGLTHVNLSGRLRDTPQGFAFGGPAMVESADVENVLAWLRGRSQGPSIEPKALNASGELLFAGDRLAVDHLAATLDRESVEGRLAYTWASATRAAALDADLRAERLDLDAIAAFGKTAADNGLEMPHQGSLALDIGQAGSAGVNARAINARLRFDGGALQIERLSVGELGGAALEISGRLDEVSSHPRGRLTLDLDAGSLDGLTNVVGKFAPRAADALRPYTERLAPTKLHAALTVASAATAGSTAKLDLKGELGLLRVGLTGEASGETSRLGAAGIKLDGRLDADDGTALLALFGLDRVIGVDQLPGNLTLDASGPLDGDLRVDGAVATSGFSAAARGTVRLNADQIPSASLQVLASAADLDPLAQAMTGQSVTAVPLSGRAAVAVAGSDVRLSHIAVAIGKSSVRGDLALTLASPVTLSGEVSANVVDATSVSALLLGLPRDGAVWSSRPVGAGAFAGLRGDVGFKFAAAGFAPALALHDLSGTAHFRPAEIRLDNVAGQFGGGQLTGGLTFHHSADSLVAHADLNLAEAGAAATFGSDPSGFDGKVNMTLQADGSGASPSALIHSLQGNGTIALGEVHLAGLDTAAFAAAMREADQDTTIEAAKVRAAVGAALVNAAVAVPQASAPLILNAGKLGITNAAAKTRDGGDLSFDGALNLASGTIDARVTLAIDPPPRALIRLRPEISLTLKGPPAAPRAELDTAALTGWLALRAAELQTRRLESLEANRRPDVIGPATRPQSPVLRMPAPGNLAEFDSSTMPWSPPLPGQRGFERLQPPPPPPPPVPTLQQPGAARTDSAPTAAAVAVPAAPTAASPAPAPAADAKAESVPLPPAPPLKRGPLDLLPRSLH